MKVVLGVLTVVFGVTFFVGRIAVSAIKVSIKNAWPKFVTHRHKINQHNSIKYVIMVLLV